MKYKVFLPDFLDSTLIEQESSWVSVFQSSKKLKKGHRIRLFIQLPSGELVPMVPEHKIERVNKIAKDAVNLYMQKVKK